MKTLLAALALTTLPAAAIELRDADLCDAVRCHEMKAHLVEYTNPVRIVLTFNRKVDSFNADGSVPYSPQISGREVIVQFDAPPHTCQVFHVYNTNEDARQQFEARVCFGHLRR